MRPADLPEYESPPLDEVVLSVQFAAWPGFQSVHLGDVWSLFRKEYPSVFEQPPLPPQFETFGGGPQEFTLPIRISGFMSSPRLWFVSKDEHQLVQFQSDRFVANWRRLGPKGQYPRFENIVDEFKRGILLLDEFARKKFASKVSVNQVEITYINIIPLSSCEDIENWINISLPIDKGIDNFVLNLPITIFNDGKPSARLFQEAQFVVIPEDNSSAIRLSFTYRGPPSSDKISDAIDFMKAGRSAIVQHFDKFTTTKAHKAWGKR